jgi:hypothetical protein
MLPLAGVVAIAAAVTAFAGGAPIPTPIGAGPRFHPAPTSRAVARMRPVGRLRCTGISHVERAHVEVFARRRVVIIPARIGVAPRSGCSYPVRTTEPTGVIEFDSTLRPTLGELFDVWGQPLSPLRLVGFRGHVRAYVAGRRWLGAVRAIRLRRHAQIVLQVGGYISPHRMYLFGPGR